MDAVAPSDNPSRRFAAEVAAKLADAGHVALFAGGCVRDELLGQTPKDYDVATDATPDRVREIFGKRRTLAVGAAFGVIIVLPPKGSDAGQVEVATFRTEGPYTDGRRPDAVVFATPEEDASRRDFTINGLFRDPATGKILDFVGGREDLRDGVIRAIGDPRARMEEDKLRLLRAVRFAARMGFEIEDETAAAIKAMASEVTVVSGERIGEEIKRMLAAPSRLAAIDLLADLGLLEHVLPEAENVRSAEAARGLIDRLDTDRFEPALTILLTHLAGRSDAPRFPEHKAPRPADLETITNRLRLSNDEADRIAWLLARRRLVTTSEWDGLPVAAKRRLMTHPDAKLLWQTAGRSPDAFPLEYLTALPNPLLTGADLIAAGLRPGPAFAAILDDVRDAQLEEKLTTREEAVAFAQKYI